MNRFVGKVAVVTGAASGIGLAIAKRMAHEGGAVVLVGLGETSLSAATQQLDRVGDVTHLAIRADVTDRSQVEDYSRSVTDRLGGIDFFFNNAGILGRVGPFLEYPDDEFDRIVATNLKSVWLAMKILTPILVRRGGGVIVNTASVAGLRGSRGLLAYCATKHAVVG